jgi:hypothetical protein
MNKESNIFKNIITVLLTLLILALAAGTASSAPVALGTAGNFAVLAGTAVTCTDSTVTGDVGVWPGTAITQTNCIVNGTVHAGDGVARQAHLSFLSAYDQYADIPCTGSLDTAYTDTALTLTPGVYCNVAAVTFTNTTLTLNGSSTDTWIFKIGTNGTGALTGTNFLVVMEGGGVPCNVYWWVAQAATLTDSNFAGTILAGAAITITGGTFNGDALAKAAVTMTGAVITGCKATGGGKSQSKCNQGVGNGPEGCDPGNSNQGNLSQSNDENGGTPGNPGRQGGNGK